MRRFIWRRALQFRTEFELRQDSPLNQLVLNFSYGLIRKRTAYLLPSNVVDLMATLSARDKAIFASPR